MFLDSLSSGKAIRILPVNDNVRIKSRKNVILAETFLQIENKTVGSSGTLY